MTNDIIVYMTTNSFNGAVIIVTSDHDPAMWAEKLAKSYFPNRSYHFTVTESTPSNVPETIRNEITQKQSKLGKASEVLTVYPTA